jgi:hypothetical protein
VLESNLVLELSKKVIELKKIVELKIFFKKILRTWLKPPPREPPPQIYNVKTETKGSLSKGRTTKHWSLRLFLG